MTDNPYMEVALHMRGLQIAQMIHVAAELGLADRIGGGQAISRLAEETGTHPQRLSRLVRALAAFGIFAIDRDGLVTHTARSEVLRSTATPTLHYAARFWGSPYMWETWGHFGDAVKSGDAAFEVAFGMPNFDYLAGHPDDAAVFDAFMRHSPDDRHAAVAEAYDFSGARVVDVGGGNGGLLRAILTKHASATGVLADQKDVVAAAAEVLGSLGARCEVVASDFFSAVPEGGTIYTMAQIMHDWSDASCQRILANCRRAMPADARLLIIERLLDDDPARNTQLNVLSDLQMMALFPDARERTLGEFTALLGEAGFRAPKVVPTRSPFMVLETGPE